MKKYNLLALAACLWMTTACSDFLELNESGYNSVEYQFSTFDRTKAVATNVYGYLKDGYSEVCSTMIDAATDDAVNEVKAGKMTATVAQKPELMGETAILTAIKLIAGEEVEKSLPVEVELVTK